MKSYKYTLALLAFLFGCYAFGQKAATKFTVSLEKEAAIHQNVQAYTNAIFDSLVQLRRDFHRHPELSDQEKRTSMKVANYLESLGLEVTPHMGGYGVVGILDTGKKGKRIAWRADIDAMASDLPDVVDFKSENEGVRHICGHDIHTTVGLGIANVLASQKEHLTGTIYFIFQPAEENIKGAKMMIADGLFNLIQPEEIYALHVSPYPVGTIATKAENVFTHITAIEVAYEAPTNQDALVNFTKELISNTQTHEPNTPFWDLNNVFSPEIGVVHPNTIYKDFVALMSDFEILKSDNTLTLKAMVLGSDREQLSTFLAAVTRKIETSEYSEAFQSVQYNFQKDMPVMFTPMNQQQLTEDTMKSVASLYGPQSTIPLYGTGPYAFSDDFAFFQESVPGVYFFLGASNFEEGVVAMPHTPNFEVDEECIKTGVNYFSSMIIERLRH